MGKPLRLEGRIFGRLTVIIRAPSIVRALPNGTVRTEGVWVCQCSCGNESNVRTRDLTHSGVQSCGCLNTRQGTAKHHMTDTPMHRLWRGMKARCSNPKHITYPYYGGRGIKVCARWAESFEAFLSDMGERPSKGHSIDRINNDGDYEPGNCKWSTRAEQRANQRKPVKYKRRWLRKPSDYRKHEAV